MMHKRTVQRVAVASVAVPMLALVVSCSSGNAVSQNQYSKVRQELQDSQAQTQQLQAQLAAAQKGGTPAAAAASPAAAAASATTAPAAGAATPAAAAGMTLLLGAYKATPAPPKPSPTPLPPGVTPAPRPTPPASLADSVGPFYVYVETLATTSPGPDNIVSNIACTPSGAFQRGQKIVWRYEIVDTSTGKRVTNSDAATVKVLLPNDITALGSFSQRGGGQAPDAPWMWSSNWEIPPDYPLGAVNYSIQITMKDGRSFTWSPPVLIANGEDTRPKVVA